MFFNFILNVVLCFMLLYVLHSMFLLTIYLMLFYDLCCFTSDVFLTLYLMLLYDSFCFTI